uniref:HAT C-terminal dimerisation domain-containing protein n=1 Tax=Amphimedon queenslandica TaxID=400682 RepID=A0A1X7UYI8_AMPQE
MLEGWEIGRERLHFVIKDNAANMKKAMTDASFSSFGCFLKTLQLIAGVVQLLAICRKLVGHFKHSTVAYQALHEIQEHLSLPPHHLQQDVKTRWNSSLYMVKSVIERKIALAAYAIVKEIPILTPTQIDLA